MAVRGERGEGNGRRGARLGASGTGDGAGELRGRAGAVVRSSLKGSVPAGRTWGAANGRAPAAFGAVPRPGTGTAIGGVPTTAVVRATAALVTRSVTPRTGARARGG